MATWGGGAVSCAVAGLPTRGVEGLIVNDCEDATSGWTRLLDLMPGTPGDERSLCGLLADPVRAGMLSAGLTLNELVVCCCPEEEEGNPPCAMRKSLMSLLVLQQHSRTNIDTGQTCSERVMWVPMNDRRPVHLPPYFEQCNINLFVG